MAFLLNLLVKNIRYGSNNDNIFSGVFAEFSIDLFSTFSCEKLFKKEIIL